MLSFKSYLPDDKGIDYLPHEEDPCKDLFEQYLNQDPIEFGDPIDASDGLQAFEFAFDDETESSESCSADSNKHVGHQPAQHQPPSNFDLEPVQQPLPLRTRHTPETGNASGRAISGSELLSLEGKPYGNDHNTSAAFSGSHAETVPTLRRKGKFNNSAQDTQRGRGQRVSKIPSVEMIRQSQRQKSPSYNEWTQRFEQFNLQTPMADPQTSPSRDTEKSRGKRPNKIQTSFDQDPQQRQTPTQHTTKTRRRSRGGQNTHFNGAATAPLPQKWQHQGNPQPSPLTASDFDFGEKPLERSQTQQLRHTPSWGYGPVSPLTPDFTVAPGQIQPSWLHGLPENSSLDSYFDNSTAPLPHPTPSLSEITPDFTSGFPYSPFNQFVNEDSSTDYTVHTTPSFLPPATTTPSPPPSSSPSKPRSHHNNPNTPTSKSPHHRRQKSMSALTLKTPRSSLSLKNARSAKDLRSPRSTGTFGFVNFTEADRGKILTGVAPSGSSKTKARRELEAADRKRKLSLAALRAIEEAGGDVEVLRRVEEFEC